MGQVEHFVSLKVTFYVDYLENCCLPLLCDFHEINIQQAWLPGKQQNIQLTSEGRDLSNERGGREWEKWQLWYKGAKNGDSWGWWESEVCLHACHSTDPATGTYLADNPQGNDLGSFTEATFIWRGTVLQQCLQYACHKISFLPPRKRGKCLEKHILFLHFPLYPSLQGKHSWLIAENFLYEQCVHSP